MTLRLPRIPRDVVLIEGIGRASAMFQRWWQSVVERIEGTVLDLEETIARVTTAETDLAALEAVNFTAGGGLTGGGNILTSPAFAVGAGIGITVGDNSVSISDTAVAPASYGSASSVATFTVNGQGQLTAAASVPINLSAGAVTGVALTKVDDTNVTLTLGGTPATSLLAATSLTLGWTGQLSVARGGTGVASSTGSTAVVLSNLPQFTSTIGVGVAASASGSGVSFPATQSASTDPNTLDDYEEGTWTPTVTPASGSITAYTATGTYTKIGQQVTAAVTITITNNGTGAGNIQATLPFTAATVFVGVGREGSITGNILQALTNGGSATMTILDYANAYPGGGGTGTARTVYATVTYFV